jgi:hypothetical protein
MVADRRLFLSNGVCWLCARGCGGFISDFCRRLRICGGFCQTVADLWWFLSNGVVGCGGRCGGGGAMCVLVEVQSAVAVNGVSERHRSLQCGWVSVRVATVVVPWWRHWRSGGHK